MEVTASKFDYFLTIEIFIGQEFELSVIVNFCCFRVDTQSSEKKGATDKDLPLGVEEGSMAAGRYDLFADAFHSFGWKWKWWVLGVLSLGEFSFLIASPWVNEGEGFVGIGGLLFGSVEEVFFVFHV